MKLITLICLLLSFSAISQIKPQNDIPLEKGYKIKLGYDDTYRTFENSQYLFVVYDKYGPFGGMNDYSYYTRIRKSDMKVMNKLTTIKYDETVIIAEDCIYYFKLAKDKDGRTADKSRWNVEMNKLDENNQVVETHRINVPKAYDKFYKPSFRVTVSEDKTKFLVSISNRSFYVMDKNMQVLFNHTYDEYLTNHYFVDNNGSAYNLRQDNKLMIYNANDNYTVTEHTLDVPKEILAKNYMFKEQNFQLYSDNRIDFVMTYEMVEYGSSTRETYRRNVHFAVSPRTMDVIAHGASERGMNNIIELFGGLEVVTDQPLILQLPNEFTVAKFKSGNVFFAQQGEYSYTKLVRTNKDRSRTLYMDLVGKNGEKLISNQYTIVTRGVLSQHGIGVDLNSETVGVIFNLHQKDLQQYLSQNANKTDFKANKIADKPQKMIGVMDLFSVKDGTSLYHHVVFSPEESKQQKMGSQSWFISKSKNSAYFISNSKGPHLLDLTLPN
ncbi:hypothetical protein D3C87_262060 [compost metagenome]